MRAVRIVFGLVVAALVTAGVTLWQRNPEQRALTESDRQEAGGSFVTLGDGVTHYDLAGPDSGARVLLVHGFSVPSYIWDSTAVALATAGFRVARYDYYGRGFSDRPNVRYDTDLYTRQLGELLDSLGWKGPVHLMGLSFGGPVVAAFAGAHRDRVRSVTLVDPAAGPSGTLPWYLRTPVLGEFLFQTLRVPGMADGQLSDFVEPAKWPDWPNRYRAQMQYKGFGRSLLRTLVAGQGVSRDSLFRSAGATGVPAMLIWGTEDQTVTIDNAAGVRQAIPQIEYHPIERAGHLPHMERTDVVNPLLVEFLTKH